MSKLLNKSGASKLVLGLILALAFVGFSFTGVASAQNMTVEQLFQLLSGLDPATLGQLSTMLGGSTAGTPSMMSSGCTFTTDLTVGSSGNDVTCLQSTLISKGFAIPAGATGYFGAQTKAAVVAWQTTAGVPATGYFGPLSRASFAVTMGGGTPMPPVGGTPTCPAGFNCTPTNVPPATCPAGFTCTPVGGGTPVTGGSTGLTGGAGSIEDADFVSSFSGEEVGEDDADVAIAGLEIDADAGSDLEITAVRLDFDQGTANQDWDNYAEDVSIWFNGEEVARVDADEFNDYNAFDKTISLDSGAIIQADENNAELVVKVSGVNNLDTNDATDTWTVTITSVRFKDAQGASVTDTATGDIGTETRSFSFETYATASDIELKILREDADINDPQVIEVHAPNKTQNVELMSFTLEAEGDSDLEIKRFGVNVDTTATHVDGIIAGSSTPAIALWIDGEEYGTATYFDDADDAEVGQDEDVLWDDVDFTIPAGDKVSVVIKADILNLTGQDVDAGDTISLTLGETETVQLGSSSLFEVEDEAGTDLVDADITGSLTAGAHEVQTAGISLAFVSASSDDDNASLDTATGDDTGIYQIVFDVTAFGSAMFIDGDVVAATTSNAANDGITWASTTNSTGGASTSVLAILDAEGSETNDVTTAAARSFEVPEDTTRRFTLDVQISSGGTNSADLVQGVRIIGLKWDTNSGDDHANVYSLDLGDFKTGVENLNYQQ